MTRSLLSRSRSLGVAVWLLGLLAMPWPVHALVLSIDQPNRTSSPGATEIFTGTITNDTGADLAAQAVFLNFSGFDPGVLSFGQLLGFPDFAIPGGTTTPDVALFDAVVGSAATGLGSPYLADVQAQDLAGDLSNVATVSIAVPEPSSVALLLAGLGLLVAAGLRRTASGPPGSSRRVMRLTLARLGFALLAATVAAPARADTTPVKLGTGQIGSVVWDDGTVSLAVPIVNTGTAAAANVVVRSVALRSLAVAGTRTDGAVLPLSLGPIVPDAQAVLTTRFSGLPTALSYLLTVSGTYDVAGTRQGFSVNNWVAPLRSTGGTTPARTGFVVKHRPSGVPLPPSPVIQENENNPGGPPVPIGPFQRLFPVAPNSTPAMPESSAPNVVFTRDTSTNQAAALIPPDPTAAAGGGVVFATANSYALVSTDGGVSFTRIDPTTIFNQDDGGLCCDQVITYVPSVNLFFWLLQYKDAAPVPPSGVGANRLRVAYATPAAIAANVYTAWTYVDLQTSTFAVVNADLDFPDLAFTDRFLYASVDTTKGSSNGLVVSRMSLSDLANPAVTTVGVSYISPNETTDQIRAFGSRLTQSSADAMYWAGHVGTNKLEVFQWPDASGSVTSNVVNINTYCNQNQNYASTGPDGFQWLDNTRSSGTGAVIGATRRPFRGLVPPGDPIPNGEVWFAWGAASDDATCKNSRPQPYVVIARMDDQTLQQVGEYDIWNAGFAFAYPSLATDRNGEIGVALAWGGGGTYGSTAAGYLGDYVVYYNEPSDGTVRAYQIDAAGNFVLDSAGNPIVIGTRFGDYFSVRNTGANDPRFASLGYATKLVTPAPGATCQSAGGCTYHPHYVEWGRPPVQGPR